MTIKVGLCGFSMAMGDYPLHFPVVEVQQTFYEPPANTTLLRWASLMPPAFEFTLKAWQLITHDAASPTYRRLRSNLDRTGCGSFRDSLFNNLPRVGDARRFRMAGSSEGD